MKPKILSITDLKFRYENSDRSILDIPSFFIEKEEKVFLYGPSGSGKSTLLSLIAGILTPKNGSIHFCEKEFGKLSPSLRDRIRGEKMGYIFQMFNLIPFLSVLENILLPCQINPERNSQFSSNLHIENEAVSLCRIFKIDHILQTPVTKISIGQQQRVAAVRSLLGKPEMIIADEPTSALDKEMQDTFMKILLQQCQAQQSTLLFVSHDKSLAHNFDRLVDLTQLNRVAHV